MKYALFFKRMRFFVAFLAFFDVAALAFFVSANTNAFLDENLKLLLLILGVTSILLAVCALASLIMVIITFAAPRRVVILRLVLPYIGLIILGSALLIFSRAVLYLAR
ncbi:MAG: hypothetical protein Ta2A_06310 [Treponemataceae bacterium]|nr:MAG: hypothetical protein Ta2A_06310 [Treponemataceae bacterium]